jgi:hypothetical protein
MKRYFGQFYRIFSLNKIIKDVQAKAMTAATENLFDHTRSLMQAFKKFEVCALSFFRYLHMQSLLADTVRGRIDKP